MKDKATIRYLGYKTLSDGGRGFDFSFALVGTEASMITIEAAANLFKGPERMAIQEGAGICFETLRSMIEADTAIPRHRLSLKSDDIALHRKTAPPTGRRY